jgi:hypothetical protein
LAPLLRPIAGATAPRGARDARTGHGEQAHLMAAALLVTDT